MLQDEGAEGSALARKIKKLLAYAVKQVLPTHEEICWNYGQFVVKIYPGSL